MATALALAIAIPAAAAAQTSAAPSEAQESTVDGIVVLGMPLRDQVETFVDTVTGPPPGRGPARWNERSGVCVGVVNLAREAAQAMADRVSGVAGDLGLRIGEPGCSPNIIIIATDDAPGLTRAMVERSPYAFRPAYAGAARSSRELELFVSSDRPIRWWHVAIPVVGENGGPAVRMPGDESPPLIPGSGRLTTEVRNRLLRAYVIVDIDQAEGLTLRQLSDYVAMVALVQIDPDAQVDGFNTILNVVTDPSTASQLTDWDHAYLSSFYDVELNQRNPAAQAGAIASAMYRDRRQAEAEATPE
ncbi:MAG: hypothetical protein ACK4FG_03240 [Brevundimonas sp.]